MMLKLLQIEKFMKSISETKMKIISLNANQITISVDQLGNSCRASITSEFLICCYCKKHNLSEIVLFPTLRLTELIEQ